MSINTSDIQRSGPEAQKQTIILKGAPRTKKNSQQIVKLHGRYCVIPSKAYKDYETACLWQIKGHRTIDKPVNVKCTYFMPTRRRCDLVNLQEATLDILVKAKVLADDNSNIVRSMDGSRVLYDKDNPRVEIEIEEAER